ncbi:unnamed protein product [Gongylonema pulchrum]|uniref:G_PROTEIN_RECEP_F1_2 domain-containing protein n=1 Tax=Gongylonema pulchrum TaxID=637853 RepID=A0A183ERM4_9BILA|nr:unnamed protein product [Gongylonema pulchrum]
MNASNVESAAPDDQEGADLYMIILPIIVIFGLCGNVISLVTIFHSRLREVSCPLSSIMYVIWALIQ